MLILLLFSNLFLILIDLILLILHLENCNKPVSNTIHTSVSNPSNPVQLVTFLICVICTKDFCTTTESRTPFYSILVPHEHSSGPISYQTLPLLFYYLAISYPRLLPNLSLLPERYSPNIPA